VEVVVKEMQVLQQTQSEQNQETVTTGKLSCQLGIAHAVAQVVYHWPVTTGFSPGAVRMGFVVDKVTLGQVFL
jgi:hypothetical protein